MSQGRREAKAKMGDVLPSWPQLCKTPTSSRSENICLDKPCGTAWNHSVTGHFDVYGEMVNNFLPFSCHSLVNIWLNPHHFWHVLSDLHCGRESLQGLECWSCGNPHHSECNEGHIEGRYLHLESRSTL